MPRVARALTCEQVALLVDHHRLSRRDITNELESLCIQGHALGCDHVLDLPVIGLALAIHQWTNTIRVAEADDTVTGDHGHRRIAATATLVNTRYGFENIVLGDAQLALALYFVGKHVEQDLGIGIGIDMAQIFTKQVALELGGVGEIAIVRQ